MWADLMACNDNDDALHVKTRKHTRDADEWKGAANKP